MTTKNALGRSFRRSPLWPLGLALTLVGGTLAACGGGDDDGGGGFGQFGNQPTTGASGGGSANTPSGSGGGNGGSGTTTETGPPPNISANPGEARIEVEGETIVFGGSNILYYICQTTDGVQVNMQTGDGHDLLLEYRSGNGRITARDTGSSFYYAGLLTGRGLWIEGDTVVFSGQLEKQPERDRLNAEDVDVTLVVNCAPPGGEHARAEVDGMSFEFPASGTQSYVCEIAERFTVNIQHPRDGGWLQIEGRQQGDRWLGNATIRLENTSYRSQLPADGEGLDIDGKRITYEGMFELYDERARTVLKENLPGTVSLTCP